jgi:predicted small metal-binding protein
MEMVKLNIAYDLLQTTKLSSNAKENDKILQCISSQVYFVICNSCYWCASYFGIDDLESLSASSSHVLHCHVCNSHNTELIPISTDESFRIEYNPSQGIELEFYRSNNVVVRQQSSNEDWARSFCLRCADVGLDCDCVVFGSSEMNTLDKTIMHMLDHHAIKPEEMTTCMKLKIKENVHTSP